MALDGDAFVWAEIPNENEVASARYYARTANGTVSDLGMGNTDTLVWCDGAAYFSRDPLTDPGRSEVLRWSPTLGYQVAYRQPRAGRSIISGVRCAGARLTVTVRGYDVSDIVRLTASTH